MVNVLTGMMKTLTMDAEAPIEKLSVSFVTPLGLLHSREEAIEALKLADIEPHVTFLLPVVVAWSGKNYEPIQR